MYHVSAQGVDERMINVHYYYYYKEDCYKKTGLPWVLLNSAVEACTQTLRKLLVTNTLTTVPCGRCT